MTMLVCCSMVMLPSRLKVSVPEPANSPSQEILRRWVVVSVQSSSTDLSVSG